MIRLASAGLLLLAGTIFVSALPAPGGAGEPINHFAEHFEYMASLPSHRNFLHPNLARTSESTMMRSGAHADRMGPEGGDPEVPRFHIGQGGRPLTHEERLNNAILGDQFAQAGDRIDVALNHMKKQPKLGCLVRGFFKGLVPGCFRTPKTRP